MTEPIFVGMRLRPLVPAEKGQPHCIEIDEDTVSLVPAILGERAVGIACKSWKVDAAMDSTDPSSRQYCDQAKAYEKMGRRMLDHMLGGYNTCLFCYGQTGTGKTTTIMGRPEPVSEQGILVRLINDIFETAGEMEAKGCSMNISAQVLEVYNEKIHDLVSPSTAKAKQRVDVCVHPRFGAYLKGATVSAVSNLSECIALIEYANTMKTVAATAMNAQSSRGHTIVKLQMEKKGGSDNTVVASEVYFADLAGRENERTTQVTGDRLVELTFINSSLMWLSSCIHSLGQQMGGGCGARRNSSFNLKEPAKPVVPKRIDMSKFRNSKLTLLLANALSGNSRTSMIGTLSPALANFEESFSTLKFASTVKSIKLEATAAADVDKGALVVQLQQELQELRRQLEQATDAGQQQELHGALKATRELVEQNSQCVDALKRESIVMAQQRAETLSKLGLANWRLAAAHVKAFKGGVAERPQMPFLANHSDDPHLAFNLMMHVPPDGSEHDLGTGTACEVRLPPALGVQALTCHIRNEGGKLIVRGAELPPEKQVFGRRWASVEVNGASVHADPVTLNDRDSIVFGHNLLFFNFETPIEPGDFSKLSSRMKKTMEHDMDDETVIRRILGEERAADDSQVGNAKDIYNQMKSRHVSREKAVGLQSFCMRMKNAQRLVEEANDITEAIRPGMLLSFQLVTQAPALGYGFPDSGDLPELAVRFVRQLTKARNLWMAATGSINTRQCVSNLVRRLSHTEARMGHTPSERQHSDCSFELLHTWTWDKFLKRLELMRQVHGQWQEDQLNFVLDPFHDPWREHGPVELAELHEHYKAKLENMREMLAEARRQAPPQQQHKVMTVHQVRDRERQLTEELKALRRIKKELAARTSELRQQRKAARLERFDEAARADLDLRDMLGSCVKIGVLNEGIVSQLRFPHVQVPAAMGETPT